MLHVRDMIPAVPEVVDEKIWETVEASEPLYRRDEATGLLLETGRSATTRRAVLRATGRRVTTGSVIQADRACADCGAALVPMGDRDFYYLACGRLNIRDPESRQPEGARWLPHRRKDAEDRAVITWEPVPSEEPYRDCVLECGGWTPDEVRP